MDQDRKKVRKVAKGPRNRWAERQEAQVIACEDS